MKLGKESVKMKVENSVLKGYLHIMSSTVENFKKICAIPRGSGNEKGVADMLEAFAAERGLSFYRDGDENVLIKKPGVGKTVVLQGHSDMVCEKNEGVAHDFEREPPRWWTATWS